MNLNNLKMTNHPPTPERAMYLFYLFAVYLNYLLSAVYLLTQFVYLFIYLFIYSSQFARGSTEVSRLYTRRRVF